MPILLAIILACGGAEDTADERLASASITDARAVPSDVMPTAVTVSWRSSAPGVGWVVYREGSRERWSPEGDVGSDHSVELVGLAADTTYSWQAVTRLDDGTEVRTDEAQLSVAAPPAELPRFDRSIYEPGSMADATFYLVLSLGGLDASYAAIIDESGRYVWWLEADPSHDVVIAEPALDGTSVLTLQNDKTALLGPAVIHRHSLGGRLLDSYPIDAAHHDFAEHPDGTLASLVYETRTMVVPDIHDEPILLGSDGIAVVGAGQRFSLLDDFGSDPWHVCSHVTEADAGIDAEWAHSNSLIYEPVSGLWWMMARNLDAILGVEPTTGAVVWQLGGLESDFEVEQPFDHGHMSDVWDGGMMVFDNQLHGGPSRVTEYAVDIQARTADEVWTYTDPFGRTSAFLGDADKIQDDRYLVVWSPYGQIEEVDASGSALFRLEAEHGNVARVTRLVSLEPSGSSD